MWDYIPKADRRKACHDWTGTSEETGEGAIDGGEGVSDGVKNVTIGVENLKHLFGGLPCFVIRNFP